MISPISVATNGYLYPYNNDTLAISVDGYLIESIIIPSRPSKTEITGGSFDGDVRKRVIKEQNDDIELFMRCYIEYMKMN